MAGTVDAVGGEREQALCVLGLKPQCVRMPVALDTVQPCTQERSADSMGVTGPTVVQAIDDFHAAGLILRDRNPADRREHVLGLTRKGGDYLSETLKVDDGAQRDLTDRIGRTKTAELNALPVALISG